MWIKNQIISKRLLKIISEGSVAVIMKILLIVLIILILICYLDAEYGFKQIVTRKICSEEQLFSEGQAKGIIDKDKYEKLDKEEIIITSGDGLKLRGIYIKGDSKLRRSIIFVHGITVGIPWSLRYIDMFVKRGWNILVYDQRRHGRSEGKYSTYGFYEKEDLDLWVNWLIERNGKEAIIGIHGESMGAATALQYLTINKYASFVISDCSFSDLNELLKYHMKNDYHLPSFPLINFTALKAKHKAKFKFSDVSPIEAVKMSSLPVMFIHGKEDKFVPAYMSEDMYNAKKGIKKLYMVKGAEHARSVEVDKEGYEREVMDFIDNLHLK